MRTSDGPRKVHIHTRLRPLRLAFLVRPTDRASLVSVLQINTCLWGGRYNPIIPLLQRAVTWWSDPRLGLPSASEILRGYLNAFEPDYVVIADRDRSRHLDFPSDRVLRPSDVLDAGRAQHVGYGVTVLDVYRHVYGKDFKFLRRRPIRVVLPRPIRSNLECFIAACFGAFPKDSALSYFEENYREAFGAEETGVDGPKYWDAVRAATPLKIGSAELDSRPGGWSPGPTLFVMDATQARDVIDFWNLRALGWRVRAVPIQWADDLVEAAERFVCANYRPYGHDRRMTHRTTLVRSRSVARETLHAFAQRLKIAERDALALQDWYPRIWDDWARDKDGASRGTVTAGQAEAECVVEEYDRLRFKTVSPDFETSHGPPQVPLWANVVNLHEYSADSHLALVVPPGLSDVGRVLGTMEPDRVSCTLEGIVVGCQSRDVAHFWHPCDGLSLVRAWLEQHGLAAELSGAGRVCHQMVRALGGPSGVHSIANPELIELLNQMAHGLVESPPQGDEDSNSKARARGRIATREQLWGLLQRINGGDNARAERHLKSLASYGVVRVGLRLKCPECAQTNWYSLDLLRDKLRCERCLRGFPFPASRPDSANWAYRTQGAFSIENYALGSYTVALCLRFLTRLGMDTEVTWTPSINIDDRSGTALEIDFAMWRHGDRYRAEPILIFGECKSFGDRFPLRDVQHARFLAHKFPGAVFVFATLRTELEPAEVKRLAAFARSGRRPYKALQWCTPVMVLTARELFSWGAPECWTDAGGRFAELASDYRAYHEIPALCEATQQLYLGMDSYPDWQTQYFGS